MEDSQTELGSSMTAKPEHPLHRPAFFGEDKSRLPPAGLPSAALDRDELQLPTALQAAIL